MKFTFVKIFTLLICLLFCSFILFKDNKTPSKFNLIKDIFEFSDKMENHDTLIIDANLSVCESEIFEKNVLIKENNKILIKTYRFEQNYQPEDDTLIFETTLYSYSNNDSLNFENLFEYMSKTERENKDINNIIFTISFKSDTIQYFSNGINDIIESTMYYNLIKRRIYPNIKVYLPIVKPEKSKDLNID